MSQRRLRRDRLVQELPGPGDVAPGQQQEGVVLLGQLQARVVPHDEPTDAVAAGQVLRLGGPALQERQRGPVGQAQHLRGQPLARHQSAGPVDLAELEQECDQPLDEGQLPTGGVVLRPQFAVGEQRLERRRTSRTQLGHHRDRVPEVGVRPRTAPRPPCLVEQLQGVPPPAEHEQGQRPPRRPGGHVTGKLAAAVGDGAEPLDVAEAAHQPSSVAPASITHSSGRTSPRSSRTDSMVVTAVA